MKSYAKITHSKDITTKEYVDEKDNELDQTKLEESDFSELSNSEILALWNKYVEGMEVS